MPQKYDFSTLPDQLTPTAQPDFSTLPDQNPGWIESGLRTVPAIVGSIGGGLIGGGTGLLGGPAAPATSTSGAVYGSMAGGAGGAAIGNILGNWYGGREFNPWEFGVETALGGVPPILGPAKFAGSGLSAVAKYAAKNAGLSALEGGLVNAAGTPFQHWAQTGSFNAPVENYLSNAGMGAAFGTVLGGGFGAYHGNQLNRPHIASLDVPYGGGGIDTPPVSLSQDFTQLPDYASPPKPHITSADFIRMRDRAQSEQMPPFLQSSPEFGVKPDQGLPPFLQGGQGFEPPPPPPNATPELTPPPPVNTQAQGINLDITDPNIIPPGTSLSDNQQVVTITSPTAAGTQFWRDRGYVSVPGLFSPEGKIQMVRGDVAPLYVTGDKKLPPPTPSRPNIPGPIPEGHLVAGDVVRVPNEQANQPEFLAGMQENYVVAQIDPTHTTFRRKTEPEQGNLGIEPIRGVIRPDRTEGSGGEMMGPDAMRMHLARMMGREPTPEEIETALARQKPAAQPTQGMAQVPQPWNHTLPVPSQMGRPPFQDWQRPGQEAPPSSEAQLRALDTPRLQGLYEDLVKSSDAALSKGDQQTHFRIEDIISLIELELGNRGHGIPPRGVYESGMDVPTGVGGLDVAGLRQQNVLGQEPTQPWLDFPGPRRILPQDAPVPPQMGQQELPFGPTPPPPPRPPQQGDPNISTDVGMVRQEPTQPSMIDQLIDQEIADSVRREQQGAVPPEMRDLSFWERMKNQARSEKGSVRVPDWVIDYLQRKFLKRAGRTATPEEIERLKVGYPYIPGAKEQVPVIPSAQQARQVPESMVDSFIEDTVKAQDFWQQRLSNFLDNKDAEGAQLALEKLNEAKAVLSALEDRGDRNLFGEQRKWDVFDPTTGRTIRTFNSEDAAAHFAASDPKLDYAEHDPSYLPDIPNPANIPGITRENVDGPFNPPRSAMDEVRKRLESGWMPPPKARGVEEIAGDLEYVLENRDTDGIAKYLREIEEQIAAAPDVQTAMNNRGELGAWADTIEDETSKRIFDRLHQLANNKYYELIRAEQGGQLPDAPGMTPGEVHEDLKNQPFMQGGGERLPQNRDEAITDANYAFSKAEQLIKDGAVKEAHQTIRDEANRLNSSGYANQADDLTRDWNKFVDDFFPNKPQVNESYQPLMGYDLSNVPPEAYNTPRNPMLEDVHRVARELGIDPDKFPKPDPYGPNPLVDAIKKAGGRYNEETGRWESGTGGLPAGGPQPKPPFPPDLDVVRALEQQARDFGLNPDDYRSLGELEDAVRKASEGDFESDMRRDPNGPEQYDRDLDEWDIGEGTPGRRPTEEEWNRPGTTPPKRPPPPTLKGGVFEEAVKYLKQVTDENVLEGMYDDASEALVYLRQHSNDTEELKLYEQLLDEIRDKLSGTTAKGPGYTVQQIPGATKHGMNWGLYIDGKLHEGYFSREAAIRGLENYKREIDPNYKTPKDVQWDEDIRGMDDAELRRRRAQLEDREDYDNPDIGPAIRAIDDELARRAEPIDISRKSVEGQPPQPKTKLQHGDLVRHGEHGIGRIVPDPDQLKAMSPDELKAYRQRVVDKPFPKRPDLDERTLKNIDDEIARRGKSQERAPGQREGETLADRDARWKKEHENWKERQRLLDLSKPLWREIINLSDEKSVQKAKDIIANADKETTQQHIEALDEWVAETAGENNFSEAGLLSDLRLLAQERLKQLEANEEGPFLQGPEDPPWELNDETRGTVVERLAKGKPAEGFRQTRFILPDGTRIGGGDHVTTAAQLGVNLSEALKAGVVRFRSIGSGAGAEIHGPLSKVQAEVLADSMFDSTNGILTVDVVHPTTGTTFNRFDRGASSTDIMKWVNGHFKTGDPIAADIVNAFREKFLPVADLDHAHFVLPNGDLRAHRNSSHEAASNSVGVELDEALKAGVIRFSRHGGAEVGGPITSEQARVLADWARVHGLFVDVNVKGQSRIFKEFDERSGKAYTIRAWIAEQFRRFGKEEKGSVTIPSSQDIYAAWQKLKGGIGNLPGAIKRSTGWGMGSVDESKQHGILKEILAVPRNATTMLDFSAPGRQGLSQIFTLDYYRALFSMARGFTHGGMRKVNARLNSYDIMRRPIDPKTGKEGKNFAEKEMGIELYTPASDAKIGSRAEATASKWLEVGIKNGPLSKLWKHTMGYPIRASNRSYMTFLNKLKINRAQKLVDMARNMSIRAVTTGRGPMPGILGGIQFRSGRNLGFTRKYTLDEAMDLNPYHNLKLAREIGDFVRTATGQAPYKLHVIPHKSWQLNLESASKLLSHTLFSPGLLFSRARMMNPSTYIMASPFVRKQYAKAMLGTVAGWAIMTEMLRNVAGDDGFVDVGWNPTSADFGKIRVGDTRLDLGGGFLQFAVAYARLYEGGSTSSSSGEFHRFGSGYQADTSEDLFERFAVNKLDPTVKFAYDVANASEYNPFHVGDRAIQMFVPLFLQDLNEIHKEDPSLLPMFGPAAFFGGGTQVYSKGESVSKFIDPENDWNVTGGGIKDLMPWNWGNDPGEESRSFPWSER